MLTTARMRADFQREDVGVLAALQFSRLGPYC
jgi:hypothetical protein